jgi:hypothetical protein
VRRSPDEPVRTDDDRDADNERGYRGQAGGERVSVSAR